jgi:hypothetical protein
MLKTLGYAVSTLSVLLLAIPSWKSAMEQPILFVALLLGIATSITGMFLRWLSFLKERRDQRRTEAEAQAAGGAQAPFRRAQRHA